MYNSENFDPTTGLLDEMLGTTGLPAPPDDDELADLESYAATGLAIIHHGSLKMQLFDKIQLAEERFGVVEETIRLLHLSQDELIKTSTTHRKMITSLKEQIKEQKNRKERLLRQQRIDSYGLMDGLKEQLDSLRRARIEIEERVNQKQQSYQQRLSQRETLKKRIEMARRQIEDSAAEWHRKAIIDQSNAEVKGKSDLALWLSILKGETDEDRKIKTRRKRIEAQKISEGENPIIAMYRRAEPKSCFGRNSDEVDQFLDTTDIERNVERLLTLREKEQEIVHRRETLIRIVNEKEASLAAKRKAAATPGA